MGFTGKPGLGSVNVTFSTPGPKSLSRCLTFSRGQQKALRAEEGEKGKNHLLSIALWEGP